MVSGARPAEKEAAFAGAMLDDLRREALERRWLPEAALATLDLARLDVESGRGLEAMQKRLADLQGIFAGPEPLAGLVAALRELPGQIAEPIATGESSKGFTQALAATLLRVLRLRGIRGGALPFA
jgi:hypothetical protein